MICLIDLLATCAEVVGAPLPESVGEDSVSFLPALRGGKGGRQSLVSHSIAGHFAIRRGNLKLCLTPGSGGWSAPRPGSPGEKDLPPVQLYDLSSDPGEKRNLASEQAETARDLTALLEEQMRNGRSTPGPPQTNTVEVKIRKDAAKNNR